MADRNAYTQPQVGLTGPARTAKVLGSDISLVAGDLVIGRTTGLLIIPAGFQLTSLSIVVPDLDTNGTPTLTFSIGDLGDTARLVATSTVGQTGGTITTLAATGLNYDFTTETEVFFRCVASAATAAPGIIRPRFFGFVRG